MAHDPIDALLRAEEDELKAKRQRLKNFARSVESAREVVESTRTSAAGIMASDGLSRADIARIFEMSSAEKALLLPSRKSGSGVSDAVSDVTAETDDDAPGPDDRDDQPSD